jgi:hypothetical protein
MNYYAQGGQVMSASQIILNDQFSQEDGAEEIIQGLSKLVDTGDAVLLQKNNTVLAVIKLDPGVVEVHLYTLDAPLPLAAAIRYFHDKLVESDIDKVYGTSPRTPQIVELMRAVGVKVLPSDNPEYSWMANV